MVKVFFVKIFIEKLISGTLMAAVPVALLNPSLGFRRKRSILESKDFKQSLILSNLIVIKNKS